MDIYSCCPGGSKGRSVVEEHGVGIMLSPHPSTYPDKRLQTFKGKLALDNGAFPAFLKKRPFDEYLFLRTLSKVLSLDLPVEFIVCPDRVGGGLASLGFSLLWEQRLACPLLALVVNDEMPPSSVIPHLDKFSHIFISGGFSKDWGTWVEFAHYHGKRAHIGRCGTEHNLRFAREIRADSVDGTNLWRNKKLHYIAKSQVPLSQMVFDF